MIKWYKLRFSIPATAFARQGCLRPGIGHRQLASGPYPRWYIAECGGGIPHILLLYKTDRGFATNSHVLF